MEAAGSNDVNHDRFFVWLAALLAVVAVVAFVASWFVPVLDERYRDAPIQHLYNLLLLVWPLFFLLQASLATAGNSRQHRSLGMAGISLATAVEFAGCASLIKVLESARADGLGAVDLANASGGAGFAGLLLFTVFFAWAVIRRRRIDVHKRMMLLATLALMQQPASGLTFIPLLPAHVLFTTLVLAIVSARDWHVRKHVHPVYLVGGGVLLALQGSRFLWAGSTLWQTIVDAILVFGQ